MDLEFKILSIPLRFQNISPIVRMVLKNSLPTRSNQRRKIVAKNRSMFGVSKLMRPNDQNFLVQIGETIDDRIQGIKE